MRITFGFLFATTVVAALAALSIEGELKPYPVVFFLWSLPIVGFFTLITAVPAYLWLQSHDRVSPSYVLIAAFVSAFVSFALFSFATKGSSAMVGTSVLIHDGSFTIAGWLSLLQQCTLMGAAGALAGVCFLLVARPQRSIRRG